MHCAVSPGVVSCTAISLTQNVPLWYVGFRVCRGWPRRVVLGEVSCTALLTDNVLILMRRGVAAPRCPRRGVMLHH